MKNNLKRKEDNISCQDRIDFFFMNLWSDLKGFQFRKFFYWAMSFLLIWWIGCLFIPLISILSTALSISLPRCV